MLVTDRERLRNRALAAWALSARSASGRPLYVTCELREHAGETYALVATIGGAVLACYRVTGQGGRVCLQREALDQAPAPPRAADTEGLRFLSAGLRARSQALAALSSQLRARSASALSRSAQSQSRAAESPRRNSAQKPAQAGNRAMTHASARQPDPLAPGSGGLADVVRAIRSGQGDRSRGRHSSPTVQQGNSNRRAPQR